MPLLLPISVLCFFVMLYVAITVAQTIRAGRSLTGEMLKTPSAAPREFFEAGEYRSPGSLRLIQQIDQHVAERSNILSGAAASSSEVAAATSNIAGASLRPPTMAQPAARVELSAEGTALVELRQDNPLQAELPREGRRRPGIAIPPDRERRTGSRSKGQVFADRRQSRQAPPNGIERRADRAHYNEDMGDLSDPYTHAGRAAGDPGRRSDPERMSATLSRILEGDEPKI